MEFLESHAVAGSKKVWINDAVIDTIANQNNNDKNSENDDTADKSDEEKKEEEESKKEKIANRVISDLEVSC